jgi:hypothetical protein
VVQQPAQEAGAADAAGEGRDAHDGILPAVLEVTRQARRASDDQ